MQAKREFIVVGAGPVGLSVAMLLNQKGHLVTVYDKRRDPRVSPENGRSINLALSHRGFQTLAMLGLEKKIKKEFAIPMKGRMVHNEEGNTNLQAYSIDNQCIYSVSRNTLNNTLLNETESKGISVLFNSKCEAYDADDESLVFESFKVSTKGKHILGCDGAFSPLRSSLKGLPDFIQKEVKLDYGYQEFTIQASKEGKWKMEKNALHIWPRKDFMLIALPNLDGSFTCTFFLKLTGEDSFQSLETVTAANLFFKEHFPDAVSIMENFDHDLIHNPVSSLFMETCSPWNLEDKLLLLGDAAHAIVPFYGQGLNAGLEDVRILLEELESANLQQAFSQFQLNRKPDTDAIGELALQNFIEMRDLVMNPTFLLKKKIESKVKNIYSDKWKTQYELVTFSHIPYTKAQKTGIENDRKVTLILENEILTKNLLNNSLTEQDLYLLSLIVL